MNPVPPVTSLTIRPTLSRHPAVLAVTIPPMADIPPPPPGSPPPTPPGYQPPQQSFSDIPPSAQGYGMPTGAQDNGNAPPAGYPQARPGISLTSQFTGIAMWSIILGILSVGVPIATGLMGNGSITVFYILPIFGFIRGVQAVTRGQMIGGIVGILLNIIGGLPSLFLLTSR